MKKICLFFAILIFTISRINAADYPEIDTIKGIQLSRSSSHERRAELIEDKALVDIILSDANECARTWDNIPISDVVKTVKICELYHTNIDELVEIYLPRSGESETQYKLRCTPRFLKMETLKLLNFSSIDNADLKKQNTKGAKSSPKRLSKKVNKQYEDYYSSLEHRQISHFYMVWDNGNGLADCKAVIACCLDLPFITLKKTYLEAQKRGITKEYFANAFSQGCIARKTNSMEIWFQRNIIG